MTSSNRPSSDSIGSATGAKGDLQDPQRPAWARCLAGIRLCSPQLLHVRMKGMSEPPVKFSATSGANA
jgi:hypothetical protein